MNSLFGKVTSQSIMLTQSSLFASDPAALPLPRHMSWLIHIALFVHLCMIYLPGAIYPIRVTIRDWCRGAARQKRWCHLSPSTSSNIWQPLPPSSHLPSLPCVIIIPLPGCCSQTCEVWGYPGLLYVAAVYGGISESRLRGGLMPCTWYKDNWVKRPSVIGALKDPINSLQGMSSVLVRGTLWFWDTAKKDRCHKWYTISLHLNTKM